MASHFRRVLTDDLTVSVDGTLRLDRDITERAVTRITVTT